MRSLWVGLCSCGGRGLVWLRAGIWQLGRVRARGGVELLGVLRAVVGISVGAGTDFSVRKFRGTPPAAGGGRAVLSLLRFVPSRGPAATLAAARQSKLCRNSSRETKPAAGRRRCWLGAKVWNYSTVAGARIQAHSRSGARRHLPDATYGRSEAGGRFRRLAACGGQGQALWDCKVLWVLVGLGKALRATSVAFGYRLPGWIC